MTETKILALIGKINYVEIYFLTLFYFLFLYFVVGFCFKFIAEFLEKRGFTNKIIEQPLKKDKQRFEIYHSLKSIVVFGFSGVIMLYFLKKGIIHLVPATVLNTLWGLLILMIWNEIHFYFFHRLLHLPYFYRKIHKIHHQSKIPSVFSVYSFHWIEAFLLSSVPLFITPFLDFSFFAIALFPLTSILFNFAGHCNYRFGSGNGNSLGLFGTKHSFHHYKNKGNFGFITDFLDQIFHKNKL